MLLFCSTGGTVICNVNVDGENLMEDRGERGDVVWDPGWLIKANMGWLVIVTPSTVIWFS